MRAVSLGLSLSAKAPIGPEPVPPPFVVALSGLTNGEARIGTHASIGYASDATNPAVQWGTAPGDATYGTGPSPADFQAGDGGNLVLTITASSATRTVSAPIRHAAPVASGGLADQTIAFGSAVPIATADDFIFQGRAVYSVTTGPSGLTIDSDTGALDAGGVSPISSTNVVVRLADANDPSRFAESGFRLTVENLSLYETADGEIEIDGAAGTVTVTIASPPVYADYDAGGGPGVFTFDAAELASGPVNLVPPQVNDDGSPAEGETLTLTPGLWVYDPDNGGIGTPTYQWRADTGGDGTFTDIGGATAESHVLTADEAGDAVGVEETLADNAGARLAASVAVAIAGGDSVSAAFVDDFATDTTADYKQPNGSSPPNNMTISGGSITAMPGTILRLDEPTFAGDYYSKVTLGGVSAFDPTNYLNMRCKMDVNFGSSFDQAGIRIRGDGRVFTFINGTSGSERAGFDFNIGDTFEIRITNGQTLMTVLYNDVPIYTDIDVSTVPNSDRIGIGDNGNAAPHFAVTHWEAGDL